MDVTVDPNVTPTFAQLGPYCVGDVAGTLPTTSTNGATGTWDAAISTAANGTITYTFTPGSGCFTTATMDVTVDPNVTPTFAQLGPYCVGDVAGTLPTTSTNGATGTWDAAISTAANGTITYTFTPGSGCFTTATMDVTVDPNVTPTFAQLGPYCVGDVAGTLPTTSTNGATGTWDAAISTAANGTITYTFTASSGCFTTATMDVTVDPNVTPTFAQLGPYCVGDVAGTLPTTSTNGATGTWDAAISTAANGTITYTFTPGSGCFTTATMDVTVDPNVTPTFAQLGPYCVGDVAGTLPTTSTNGATGTWDAAISTAANGTITYTFTPGSGCFTTATMDVVVNTTPTIILNNPSPVCSPLTVDITANAVSSTDVGTMLYYSDVAMTILVPDATIVSAGTYYVEATNAGCAANGSITVTVNALPVVNSITPSECENVSGSGQALNIDVTGLEAGLHGSGTFIWFTDNSYVTPSAPQPTDVTVSDGETFYFEVTSNGCTVQNSITYAVGNNISLNDPMPDFCEDAVGSGEVTGIDLNDFNDAVFAGATTYTWATGPTGVTINDGDIINIEVTQGTCPPVSIGVNFTVNSLPIAAVSAGGTYCETIEAIPDVTITFTGTGPWDFTYNDGTSSTSVTALTSPYTIENGIDGTYVVTAVSDANCTGSSNGSANIITNPLPTATISGGGAICAGNPIIPDVTIDLIGTGPWNITYFDGTSSVTVSTNANPYIITDGADGTYTVTNVSDVNCTGIASGVATITTNPLPTATVSGGGPYCSGETFPQVEIELEGTGPWDFEYTDGTTTTTVTGQATSPYFITSGDDGAYSMVSLTDATTCAATSLGGSVNVLTNALPTATLSIVGVNTICDGDLRPNISIELTGAGPWDFQYTDGTTTTLVTNESTNPYVLTEAADGTYSIVSVSDANACAGTFSGDETILSNPIPAAPNAGTDAIYCYDAANPPIDLFAVGTDLNWYSDAGLNTNIGTTSALTPDNTTGTTTSYYVTQTVNNCTSVATEVIVTINDVPTITNIAFADVSDCILFDGSITITAAGGTGAYTYSIDNGAIFSGNNNFTGLGVNTYQIIVDDGNCTVSATQAIAPPVPTAEPTPVSDIDFVYCLGDVYTAMEVNAGVDLSWYSDAGLTTEVGTQSTFTPETPTVLGVPVSYYVTETINGCQSTPFIFTITVNETPLPPVVTGGNTWCDGETPDGLLATAGGASSGTFMWYSDALLTTSVVNGPVLSAGNAVGVASHIFYVVDSLGNCGSTVAMGSIIISATPVFTVAATSPTTCSGTEGSLLISGLVDGNTYTVSYTENGTNVPGVSWVADVNGEILISGLTAGTFTAVTVDLAGCLATDAGTFTLTDPPVPTFTILATSPTACAGTNGQLVLSGLDASMSYAISYLDDGTLVSVTLMSDGLGEITIGALDAGAYTDVSVTLSGCTTTLAGPYNLVDPNSPNFTIGATANPSGCGIADASITINGLNPSTTYNLTYNLNGVPVGPVSITADGSGDYVISGLQGGTYDVITIDLSGCIATNPGIFTLAPIYPTAPIAFADATYCEGDVIIPINGVPAFGGTITWYSDAGLATQVGAGLAYTVLATAPGTYTYYATETLSNCEGPSSMVTVIITAAPISPVISGDVNYCEGDVIADISVTPQGAGTINWYSDALLTDLIGTGSTYTPAATAGAITYYATETVLGCVSSASSAIVTVNPNPVASFAPTPDNGNVPLDVYFDNTSIGGNTYAWNLGDGTTSTDFDPSVTYTTSDDYTATLLVTDVNGCVDNTSSVIIVEGTSTLIIPNIFTPNGDGSNDVFNLSGTNITEIKGTIMNRWGQVVFNINTVEGGWDGRTMAGIECSEGVYYYLIHALGADGVEYNYQGPIELIR